MITSAPPSLRDAILNELASLECNLTLPDGLGRFVDQRAELLAQLDALKHEWTPQQTARLHQALQAGAQVLLEAQEERSRLARKIDALKAARGTAKHTAAYVAPSWRKTV
jgi:signal transduction histidine kinase